NRRGAARTGQALASVDPPLLREVAELPVGADIVAERGAPGCDRGAQHRLHRFGEPVEPGKSDVAAGAAGRDSGEIERIADVDVAEPGDDALVEQERLDRRGPAVERAGESGAVERRAERLR